MLKNETLTKLNEMRLYTMAANFEMQQRDHAY